MPDDTATTDHPPYRHAPAVTRIALFALGAAVLFALLAHTLLLVPFAVPASMVTNDHV